MFVNVKAYYLEKCVFICDGTSTVRVKKVNVSAVSNPQDCTKRFALPFPDRLIQSKTISTYLGSIQPYATSSARRLIVHI